MADNPPERNEFAGDARGEDDSDNEIEIEVDDAVDDVVIPAPPPPPPPLPTASASNPLKRPSNDADGGQGQEQNASGQPPPPKRANEEAQGTPLQNLNRITDAIELALNQNLMGMAELFLRNEPALSNTVENLRTWLADYEGLLGDRWEPFRERLGPPQPQPQAQNPPENQQGQQQVLALNPQPQPQQQRQRPTVLTEAHVKEILRHFGKVLELHAILMRRIGYKNGDRAPPQDAADRNRVAYTIAQAMNQIADMVEYTYRQRLHNVWINLSSNVPRIRERVLTAIENEKNARAEAEAGEESGGNPALLLPEAVAGYAPVPEPHLRYRLMLPRESFLISRPQLWQDLPRPARSIQDPQSTGSLSQAEENLLVKFGSVELVSGTRTTSLAYNFHNVEFRLHEIYKTDGWVSPEEAEAPGERVRYLEFLLDQFDEDSVRHQVKLRSQPQDQEEGPTQRVEVTISGVLKKEEDTVTGNESMEGKRVEFKILLPPHLTMRHVNDVGVRDAKLKIQFAK